MIRFILSKKIDFAKLLRCLCEEDLFIQYSVALCRSLCHITSRGLTRFLHQDQINVTHIVLQTNSDEYRWVCPTKSDSHEKLAASFCSTSLLGCLIVAVVLSVSKKKRLRKRPQSERILYYSQYFTRMRETLITNFLNRATICLKAKDEAC